MRKTKIIRFLVRDGYQLDLLLKIAQLARSTYFYHLKRLDKPNKNQTLMNLIQSIYWENKENYGYQRITLELLNSGFRVNHKKVQRLMKELNLVARIRRKRRYTSYKGEVGKKADNLINKQFYATKPLEKCYTDVTEFALPNLPQKLYLSPVLDGYNSEIIRFTMSISPNLEQLKQMLENAFPKSKYKNFILHSDQGWQYQHESYHKFLEKKNIQPSMSRKGNSTDTDMMESFFGILKSEMFYGFESAFKIIEQLKTAIEDYMYYYNNKHLI